ncbi:MAG: hypothetical protein GX221_07155 [Candidatus Riflebacteria bacterium]|nr:hypothetical protein [Candidatus Riflebacteria bacterium]
MDKILDKLESKYGKYAIPNLIQYISVLMFMVFLLDSAGIISYQQLVLSGFYVIKQSQFWRIFTFLLVPMSKTPVALFFEVMILFLCARGVEAAIGTFRMNAYYFLGAFMIILASFIFPLNVFNSHFLYLSFFFAFATLYPDYELLLFFVLPVKIKYLAYFSAFLLLYAVFSSTYGLAGVLYQLLNLGLALFNYFLFFGTQHVKNKIGDVQQRRRYNAYVKEIDKATRPINKCSRCSKNEKDNPDEQFRYCTCKVCGEDGVAFCAEHLKEHKEEIAKKKGE